jgi:hypothetical protein
MDLNLKSLKNKLEICNNKLAVIDYVYYMYDKYLDDGIKEYVSLKHTMLELQINNLINEIDNVYKELEDSILERIDIIQKDIDNLKKKKIKKNKIFKSMLTYIIMNLLMNNKDFFSNNDIQYEIDKYNNEYNANIK